jgi:adenylate kinase
MIPRLGRSEQSLIREEIRNLLVIGAKGYLGSNYIEHAVKCGQYEKIVASGSFVSDSQILRLLKKSIKEKDLESGIIFDGFPRTVSQAPKLDSLLGKKGVGLNYAIFLDVPEEVAKERISGRAEKEDRKDDSDPKVIEKRFDEYKEKTLPLVDVYEKSKRLFKVDGTKGTDEVLKRVKNKLNLSKK